MKLKKLHIDAFGKFQDFTLELSDGFNLIYGSNEAGKSTLCAFICAMFYSMPNDLKKNGVHENLRQRYTPWNGGPMSGSLEFETENGTFLIERIIGENRRKDKVAVRDSRTWEPLEVGDDVGRHFLGMGREAFLNTLYTGQMESAVEKQRDDELLARLANLKQPGTDDLSEEKAERELSSALASLRSTSGRAGAMPKLEAECETLEEELTHVTELLGRHREDIIRGAELKARSESLKAELAALTEKKQEGAQYDRFLTYRRLSEELGTLRARRKDGKLEAAEKRLAEAEKRLREVERFSGAAKEDYVRACDLSKRLETLREHLIETERLEGELRAMQRERGAIKVPKAVNIPMLAVSAAVLAAGAACGILLHPLLFFLLLVGLFLTGVSLMSVPAHRAALAKTAALDALISQKRQDLDRRNPEQLARERENLLSEQEELFERFGVHEASEILDGLTKFESLRQERDARKRETDLLAEAKMQLEQDAAEKEAMRDALGLTQEAAAELASATPPERIDQQIAAKNAELLETETARKETEFGIAHRMEGCRAAAEIEEELALKREQLELYQQRYDALALALETLRGCYESQKSTFAPVLGANVLAMLLKMSGGRYTDVRVADDYQMAVREESAAAVRDAGFLSDGTRDMLHLALRLGIIKTILDSRVPFLVLDDSFTQYDEARVKQSAALLEEAFPGVQTLYFTCHEELLRLLPEADIIRL